MTKQASSKSTPPLSRIKHLILFDHAKNKPQLIQVLKNLEIKADESALLISLADSTERRLAALLAEQNSQQVTLYHYFAANTKLFHVHWLLQQMNLFAKSRYSFVLIQAVEQAPALKYLLEKQPPDLVLQQDNCQQNGVARQQLKQLAQFNQMFVEARTAFQQYNYIKAIELCTTLLDSNRPLERGNIPLELSIDLVLECFKLLAHAYDQLGQQQKMLDYCQKALDYGRQHHSKALSWPHYLRGQSYLRNKDYNKADQEFSHALNANPNDLSAADTLAQSYLQQNRLQDAQKLLEKVTKESPANTDRLEHLSAVANLNHDTATATQAIRDLASVAKEMHKAVDTKQWLLLAKSLCQQVDHNETGQDALQELQQLCSKQLDLEPEQLNNNTCDLFIRRHLITGNSAFQLKDSHAAAKSYSFAEDLYDNNYHEMSSQARAEVAQEFYESDYFIAKGDLILKELLWRYRDDDKVSNYIQVFFKGEPFNANEANSIGIQFYKKHRYQMAVQLLDVAAQISPETHPIQLNAAQANLTLFRQVKDSKKRYSEQNIKTYFENIVECSNNLSDKHKKRYEALKKNFDKLT